VLTDFSLRNLIFALLSLALVVAIAWSVVRRIITGTRALRKRSRR